MSHRSAAILLAILSLAGCTAPPVIVRVATPAPYATPQAPPPVRVAGLMPLARGPGVMRRDPLRAIFMPGYPQRSCSGRSSRRALSRQSAGERRSARDTQRAFNSAILGTTSGAALAAFLAEPRRSRERGTRGLARADPDEAADDNAPFLPWPPPAPTAMGEITQRLGLTGAGAAGQSLGMIERRLRARLAARGYESLRYFAVPGGFGMTTEVERFAADGRPATPRWLTGKTGGVGGWIAYLRNLITGESGAFRVFALVVTNQEVRPAPFEATEADLERWRSAGNMALSARRAAMPATARTRAWLLVYEFTSARGKGATLMAARRGAVSLATHERAAGLR